jgi:glycine dehydrogenase
MSSRPESLADLEDRELFARRHIGPDADEQATMLAALGLASLDELIDRVVPTSIRWDKPLDLPAPLTELETIERLRALARRNTVATSLIGMGYAATITPPVIARNVLENPAWYTAYTPYQPEISQGRLEALLNFQTMVSDLTGMELANASLLDEATAAAEAMALCHRLNPKAGSLFFVDHDCHPQSIAVVQTRAAALGLDVVVGDPFSSLPSTDVFGVLLSYPGSSGAVRDHVPVVEAAHAAGALVAVAVDLLAMVVLRPPGEIGADVVVGSSQRFGVPLGFGGPHAAFMAVRQSAKRTLPGRLVGVSVDTAGRQAYRLALQTREQHIRREKATSNICTAQVLLAVIAGFYAAYHGPDGLRRIAERVHRLTDVLAEGLRSAGFVLEHEHFFDTILVGSGPDATTSGVVERAAELGLNLRTFGLPEGSIGITLDETSTRATVERVWQAFGVDASAGDVAAARLETDVHAARIPIALRRSSSFLTHPVFNTHHSETDMLRYLRRLADRDIALDRAMIPLGSCTMKLNATTEMLPITWPEFSDIHPFAPSTQTEGYRELIAELEHMLVEITGYDSVSLQPNAGSQGEFAGLLAIQAYHRSRGDTDRDVCLIPASAHGTNAASAAMAGMHVVVVACDEQGNVDVADLRAKVDQHAHRLSCLMVTYPSTHGVFEAGISALCEIVHRQGGQVYLDGANLNALVGVAKPGQFGADVSHLNLHKTFCIPHGGGGPGVGPVAVKAHLAPFLPNHPVVADAGPATGVGPVAAAPWGSAGILPISWAYVTMMGATGLLTATHTAILAANYIARRLSGYFPILYTGQNDMVAHECIVDIRPITKDTGVTVDDIAKRLIDYGFHAPTMSFPVAGTLMIEPTESESLAEIDRFCDAMIAIRSEIDHVAGGAWPVDDNPLHDAPHPAEDVVADTWNHPYTREVAAYPVPALRHSKYWPPVSRIDGAYGDRNVVCSCPPLEAYQD